LNIFIQKYANFIKEVNGLELAIDFNNIKEGNFHGINTYPKELYTKDLSIGMKTVLEENSIHPRPFKFVYGMQQKRISNITM
jgi:hypothetical protein